MGIRKSHLITSFSVPDTKENRDMLTALEQLAAKDGWSLSELIRNALTEYAKRHFPGNPQLALVHWTDYVPMPETIRTRNRNELKQPSELFEEEVQRLVERAKKLDAEKK